MKLIGANAAGDYVLARAIRSTTFFQNPRSTKETLLRVKAYLELRWRVFSSKEGRMHLI